DLREPLPRILAQSEWHLVRLLFLDVEGVEVVTVVDQHRVGGLLNPLLRQAGYELRRPRRLPEQGEILDRGLGRLKRTDKSKLFGRDGEPDKLAAQLRDEPSDLAAATGIEGIGRAIDDERKIVLAALQRRHQEGVAHGKRLPDACARLVL